MEYRYRRLGEVVRKKDQNETVHEYEVEPFHAYLDLGGSPAEVRCGRLAVDRVTILGPGIDAAVRRIETQHDLLGRVATITSFDAPSGGTALNQVVREYTGFGRLAREYQEHSGVKHAGTPYVEYDYAGASSGLRPVSLRYPNGRLLHYTYGTADSDAYVLGRLDAICDANAGSPGAPLAQYTYLGLGTVVVEDYAQPQVKLDLWGGTSGAYAGFDRFGRIVDHLWRDYGSSTDADRILYGYDRAGNRLWRANPVAAAQNPAVYLDELYQYDGVSQLIGLERGQLSAGRDAVTNKTFAEDWSLDATGNWSAFRQDRDDNGTCDLDQSRKHNKANEVTSASSWVTPAHDRAANMTSMPKPASPADALSATFDAWNRMVRGEDGQNTVAEYQYTPDNRRAVKKTYTGGALSETRHFYYTDQWQAIEERTASGGAIAADPETQYVWGASYVDHLIFRDRDTTANGTLNERLYALHDANWNVTALINPSGTVVERYTYTAYGTIEVRNAVFQPTAAASAYAWPYTYTTRRLDLETGLMYYRNRMYHPGLGRFVSRDPIGYIAVTLPNEAFEWHGRFTTEWEEGLTKARAQYQTLDLNLHSYGANAPTGAVDSHGLFSWPTVLGRLLGRGASTQFEAGGSRRLNQEEPYYCICGFRYLCRVWAFEVIGSGETERAVWTPPSHGLLDGNPSNPPTYLAPKDGPVPDLTYIKFRGTGYANRPTSEECWELAEQHGLTRETRRVYRHRYFDSETGTERLVTVKCHWRLQKADFRISIDVPEVPQVINPPHIPQLL